MADPGITSILQRLDLGEENPGAYLGDPGAGSAGWSTARDTSIASINPATGNSIASVWACSAADYEQVLAASSETFLRWRLYPSTLIRENRWRAQRYGTGGELLDHGRGDAVPFPDLVDEMIDIFTTDATELDCLEEIRRARRIAAEGSSADRQRAVHHRLPAARPRLPPGPDRRQRQPRR